ncbi:MAG: hypothetical protein AB7O49_04235 [Sphingomonadales bacterium]
MDKYRKDVVRRLFVAATELLEDNHIVAVDGQNQRASLDDFRQGARQLQVAAGQLATLAGAVIVLLDMDAGTTEPDR